MKRNDRGYALLISMIALVVLSTLTGLMALSTGADTRRSNTTRTDLQTYYVSETGVETAVLWFRNNYRLLGSTLVNTAPATPPTVTDPLGNTYTTTVSLTSGAPIVFNTAGTGTATTHPSSYTNYRGVAETNKTTSFTTSLQNQTVSLGTQGSGTFSVMATLINYSPERWRVDSVGTYAGRQRAVSVELERLPLTPFIQAAYTSASPVDLTGNQTIDGRDHDINCNVVAGDGLPGVSVTNTNPIPDVSGSGEVSANVGGSTVTIDSGTTHPDPLPVNYPVNNDLDPDIYPINPAAALGLDPAVYQPYLDGMAQTSVPCVIEGLVVLDMNFPTGSGSGGCDYDGTGILILHNPRYNPRYFDPIDPLYYSSTSPIPGQTAAEYRADTANQPRSFNYNANNTFRGIIIADSVGEIGPGITGNAALIGAIISLDRVNGAIGHGNAEICYSSIAVTQAVNSVPYTKRRETFRHLLPN
jgi:hypothetical protein